MRRKGKYVNDTFLRRKDAEEWAPEVERRIDRGEPAIARGSRDAKTFGDLIKLHREDLQGVGKRIGRSKGVSLTFLERQTSRPKPCRSTSAPKAVDTDAKATNAAGIDFASAMSMMTLCRAGTLFSLPRLSSRPSAAAQPDNPTCMATIRLSLSNSPQASRAP